MNGNDIIKMGVPEGPAVGLALKAYQQSDDSDQLRKVINSPENYVNDTIFGNLAQYLSQKIDDSPGPCVIFGEEMIEQQAIDQMDFSLRLPVSVRGALMPDAHLGYGLPIGGVLATKNAVIPNAVGVDIACRLKLSVLDLSPEAFENDHKRLADAVVRETEFGTGKTFKKPKEHHVMQDDRWNSTNLLSGLKDKAWRQLGTSGSGNHFCDIGVVKFANSNVKNVAIMTHSGSRGPGATVASHYCKLAKSRLPNKYNEFKNLAWLDLDQQEGQEYWEAMNLMGDYASANHSVIHQSISRNLGAEILASYEHHHNFAWLETHGGGQVVVHRKGATPAGTDDIGIIPSSMGGKAYLVSGKGNSSSLNSSSHGAGRVMSRKEAKKKVDRKKCETELKQKGIYLLGGGTDEMPCVYKSLDKVMEAQKELVSVVATFWPKIVRMDD